MHNSKLFHGLVVLLPAVFLTGLAVGCSPSAKTARHLERANNYYEAGQYESAEIEYLNVLRQERTNQVAIRNLGLMAHEQGRLGRAFALLNAAKKSDPEDFQVGLHLAQCLLAGGGVESARAAALELLVKSPTNEQVLLLLVHSSLTTNQLQDTQQRLAGLESVAGGSAGYEVARGLIQLRARDLPAAESSFTKALSLDTNSITAHLGLGNLHTLRKELTSAGIEYQKAAELSPPRSPHRLQYVDFKLVTGEVAEARKVLDQMSQQTPDFLPAKTRLARLALAEHRLDECQLILKDVLARDSTHLEAMLLQARLLTEKDESAKAVIVLERVVKEYPNVPPIHYQLAEAQLRNNQPEADVINSLNRALSLQPDFPEALMLLAELNLRLGDAGSAITSLTKLIAQRPELPGPPLLLAAAYQGKGKLDEAIQVFQNLAHIYPKNPQILLRIGALLQRQGKKDEARERYESALTINPRYLPAIEQVVMLDLAERRFANARERAQKEVEQGSQSPAPYVLLARVSLAETNFAAAESTLLKALELAPDSAAASALLVRTYVASGRQREALQKLQEVVVRRTNDLGAWMLIAQLQRASSNYTAARIAYEQVLTLNPQFAPALNNLAWLCLEHLGDSKRAYDLASKARRLQPNDPSVADTLGWVLCRSGDYARALTLIKESSQKFPDNPEITFHLGMTLYMMGQETAAKTAFQQALQSGDVGAWRQEAERRLRVLEADPSTADPEMIKEFQSLLASSPDDPVLQTRMASVFEREGKWAQAAAGYEKALNLNSNLVPVMVRLAQIYSGNLNDPQRALAYARQARNLEPNDPQIAHTLGKLAYDSAAAAADHQWAYSLLHESARKLPADPRVLFDYAWASCAAGRLGDAVEAMQKVAQTQPPTSMSDRAAKWVQMNALLGKPSEAEAKVAEVQAQLQAEPDHLPALMVMGMIQEKRAEFRAAADTYERILKRFPLFSPATKLLAGLYFDPLRDAAKAHDYARQARDAFPQDAQVARILGLLEYQRGGYARAALLLTESASRFPADAEIQFRLGMSQHKLNRNAECRQTLTKALGLAPDSPLAQEAKQLLTQLEEASSSP